VGLGHGDSHRNRTCNDGQIPHFRGVRVALGTGYNPGEGNRRASRNGRVSDLPPESPTVTIRNCFVAVHQRMMHDAHDSRDVTFFFPQVTTLLGAADEAAGAGASVDPAALQTGIGIPVEF
jgi:hypothetical protein